MSCKVCLKPCRKASHRCSRCSVENEVDWMMKATLQGRRARESLENMPNSSSLDPFMECQAVGQTGGSLSRNQGSCARPSA